MASNKVLDQLEALRKELVNLDRAKPSDGQRAPNCSEEQVSPTPDTPWRRRSTRRCRLHPARARERLPVLPSCEQPLRARHPDRHQKRVPVQPSPGGPGPAVVDTPPHTAWRHSSPSPGADSGHERRCLTSSCCQSRGRVRTRPPAALYGVYTAWNSYQGASATGAVGQAPSLLLTRAQSCCTLRPRPQRRPEPLSVAASSAGCLLVRLRECHQEVFRDVLGRVSLWRDAGFHCRKRHWGTALKHAAPAADDRRARPVHWGSYCQGTRRAGAPDTRRARFAPHGPRQRRLTQELAPRLIAVLATCELARLRQLLTSEVDRERVRPLWRMPGEEP